MSSPPWIVIYQNPWPIALVFLLSLGRLVAQIPVLEIELHDHEIVRLTWDAAVGDHMLQQSAELNDQGAWNLVLGAPTMTGGRLVLDLPLRDTQRFYRLGAESIIFVDGANDTEGSGTFLDPFQTLALATEEAEARFDRGGASQMIYVFSNEYREAVRLQGTERPGYQVTLLDSSIPLAYGDRILGGDPKAAIRAPAGEPAITIEDLAVFSLHGFDVTGSGAPALNVAEVERLRVSSTTLASTGGSSGIRIEKVARGDVSVDDVAVSNSTGSGIEVIDCTGAFHFQAGTIEQPGEHGIFLQNTAGEFVFHDASVADPGASFSGVSIENLASDGMVDYRGSIASHGGGELVSINKTAAGSLVSFGKNADDSGTISGDGGGGIFMFDADGDVEVDTPISITNAKKGFLLTGISLFGGGGDVVFADTTIILTDNGGYNAGVEINGQMGNVSFTNLNITTDDTVIGASGMSVAFANRVIVRGEANTIHSNGAAAIELGEVDTIDFVFEELTTTNTLEQAGKRNGITMSDLRAGTLTVTGNTRLSNLAGSGMFINGVDGNFHFAHLDLFGVGGDGLNLGVVTSNPGTFRIDSGDFNGIGGDGIRAGNTGNGTGGGVLDVNNVAFRNIGGFTANLSNTTLNGTGNTANPISTMDGGGNSGTMVFNGGADTVP